MSIENRENAVVTILLPHYRTPELAKLCLRSLKKHTDLNKIKVIVMDNNSGDESIEYLRSLKWITLIERETVDGETPSESHVRAMALGMEQVTTPYVLSLHTDTVVTSDSWLEFLLQTIEAEENIAGVGSWKLEYKSPLRRWLKAIEEFWQLKIWYPITGQGSGKIVGAGKNHYFLRSHCALYKTDLVRQYTDGFGDSGECAGKGMHRKLAEKGFKLLFIPSNELINYMQHLNHATMILNPEIAGKKTGKPKARRRIKKELRSIGYSQILNDSSLD
jgi:glycosyltransferase involved in cell wall biosynthesis